LYPQFKRVADDTCDSRIIDDARELHVTLTTRESQVFSKLNYSKISTILESKKKKTSTSHDILWETANSNDFSIHFVLQQKHMETWQNASNLLAEKATCANL